MAEWSKVSDILDEIRAEDSVLDVSLISRGGMYVMGNAPQDVHEETYAAMSAIIMGAAETTSSELKDNLTDVVLKLTEKNLILTAVGPRYMMAIGLEPKGDLEDLMGRVRGKISEIEVTL